MKRQNYINKVLFKDYTNYFKISFFIILYNFKDEINNFIIIIIFHDKRDNVMEVCVCVQDHS